MVWLNCPYSSSFEIFQLYLTLYRNLVNSELKEEKKRVLVMPSQCLCCLPHPSQNWHSNFSKSKTAISPNTNCKFSNSFLLFPCFFRLHWLATQSELEQQQIQGLRHYKWILIVWFINFLRDLWLSSGNNKTEARYVLYSWSHISVCSRKQKKKQ